MARKEVSCAKNRKRSVKAGNQRLRNRRRLALHIISLWKRTRIGPNCFVQEARRHHRDLPRNEAIGRESVHRRAEPLPRKKSGAGDSLHTQEPVTVASFRTWRGWREYVARDRYLTQSILAFPLGT